MDELITRETALLAREAGFDWEEPCDCGGFPDCICDDVKRQIKDYVYQCTQTTLSRWLREVKRVYLFPYPRLGPKCGYDTFRVAGYSYEARVENWAWHYGEFGEDDPNDPDYVDHNDRYDTFELAQEAGLVACLKWLLRQNKKAEQE